MYLDIAIILIQVEQRGEVFNMPIPISSFQDYLEKTESFKGANLFRGQANRGWRIVPSLFRKSDTTAEEITILEEILGNDSLIESLFEKQHYGSATRLLDLTVSPMSALFFAIDDDNEKANDGIVYVFANANSIDVSDIRINAFLDSVSRNPINIPVPLHDFSVTNHLIKYAPKLAYSNERAFHQGGTALLVGLHQDGSTYSRAHDPNLESQVIESFLIPASLKESLRQKLCDFGYERAILYDDYLNFETTPAFDSIDTHFEVFDKVDFKEIIFHTKLSCINCDRDALTMKIEKKYNELFRKFGENSRIFGLFYFDEIDKSISNWICQSRWSDSSRMNIKWKHDYFRSRLLRTNEEVSNEILFNRVSPTLESAKKLLRDIVAYSDNEIDKILTFYESQRRSSSALVQAISDCPYSTVDLEQFAADSIIFINRVDKITEEILIFAKQGDSPKSLLYWNDFLIGDAIKSAKKLNHSYNSDFWSDT